MPNRKQTKVSVIRPIEVQVTRWEASDGSTWEGEGEAIKQEILLLVEKHVDFNELTGRKLVDLLLDPDFIGLILPLLPRVGFGPLLLQAWKGHVNEHTSTRKEEL